MLTFKPSTRPCAASDLDLQPSVAAAAEGKKILSFGAVFLTARGRADIFAAEARRRREKAFCFQAAAPPHLGGEKDLRDSFRFLNSGGICVEGASRRKGRIYMLTRKAEKLLANPALHTEKRSK